jgi:adenylate cyclase
MDFRKRRLPAAIVGLVVLAAVLYAWATNRFGLRVGIRDFATAVAMPRLVAAAAEWARLPADIVAMFDAAKSAPRPTWADRAEIAGAVGLGVLAVLLATLRRPLAATMLTLILCLAWTAGAVGLGLARQNLVDFAGPPLLALIAFVPTAIAACMFARRHARALQHHFGERLSPDVLKRIGDDPSVLKLSGEYRDVTVLFADIDGFTKLAEQAEPADVVQVLDGYLAVLTGEVHAHGGMIDRRVGDSVFVLFNAPVDLADHPRRAIACARAIVAATEAYRQTSLAKKLSLGRTRIGIETGPAIVGDVGGGRSFDYAVHGEVMVTVSRLEVANKALGTSICIGPGTASRLAPRELVQRGSLAVRGRAGSFPVYTLAPPSQDSA